MTRLEELRALAEDLGMQRCTWGYAGSNLGRVGWKNGEGEVICTDDDYGCWWLEKGWRVVGYSKRFPDEENVLEYVLTLIYVRLM